MIKGVHAMFYSSQPEELRAFLRDKMQLPYTDVGDGWLIFDLAEGDVGCHPTEGDPASGTHDVSFYCDDIQATVSSLKSRGVVFDEEIADHGYGFVTHLTMPGGVRVQVYQPKYAKRVRPAAGAAGTPAGRKAGSGSKRPAARARKAAGSTSMGPKRTSGRTASRGGSKRKSAARAASRQGRSRRRR